jgi:hypothetical protein
MLEDLSPDPCTTTPVEALDDRSPDPWTTIPGVTLELSNWD